MACIEPYFLGSGKITKVLTSNDYYQPTRYSYFLGTGTTTNPEYLANNNFFTSYDFGNNNHIPLTGYEHSSTKLFKSYLKSANNSFFYSVIQL